MKQHWYTSPVREEWAAKIASLGTVADALACLKAFKIQHLGPDRETYELKKEANWIESRIEMRLAQLHSEESISDDALLNKTIEGECAATVASRWLKKADGAHDPIAMQKICTAYRKACKPPMMPINYFAPVEKALVSKLLKLRAPTYLTIPLDELRQLRGVTEISVQ
ncbi:hypothetical protein K9U39_19565 [Rhodoblastus acidophilus]|uniref:Uncharacterized protein n=2 Tax=Candidatus Rhodoblastus alkanivorans TaxID=2954117 RepID=A0ABS9ZB96_9HYPH|nr:hypothetical protein [Candidatus Rhodoblastus alkanivorans]MCI4684989.1 hypothetical protein [Candidatus Rhodoblastus alkanivorans]MDI4643101.1 hypothetical protein [Rhodoblastus acidophilus]